MIEPKITVIVNPLSTLCEEFTEYSQEFVERCSNCGSSLFYLYNEPVPEGEYIQNVCAVCGSRQGGYINNFREDQEEKSND